MSAVNLDMNRKGIPVMCPKDGRAFMYRGKSMEKTCCPSCGAHVDLRKQTIEKAVQNEK